MRLLKQQYGAEHLWFADDIFRAEPPLARRILRSPWRTCVARYPSRFRARADLLTREAVRGAQKIGVVQKSGWAIESGSQKSLGCHGQGIARRGGWWLQGKT